MYAINVQRTTAKFHQVNPLVSSGICWKRKRRVSNCALSSQLLRHGQHDGGWVFFRPINALGGLYKLGFRGVGNIYKFLRVAIDERKPSALDLYHNAMAAAKRVIDDG